MDVHERANAALAALDYATRTLTEDEFEQLADAAHKTRDGRTLGVLDSGAWTIASGVDERTLRLLCEDWDTQGSDEVEEA
jgi:hypothetical protein